METFAKRESPTSEDTGTSTHDVFSPRADSRHQNMFASEYMSDHRELLTSSQPSKNDQAPDPRTLSARKQVSMPLLVTATATIITSPKSTKKFMGFRGQSKVELPTIDEGDVPPKDMLTSPKLSPRSLPFVMKKAKSVSSLNYSPKAYKTKYSKQTKESKKAWKKTLATLELWHPFNNFGADGKFLDDCNFRGNYLPNEQCAVRVVFLRKEDKVAFYEQMNAVSHVDHPNVNKVIGARSGKKIKWKNESIYSNSRTRSGSAVLVASELAQGETLRFLLKSDQLNFKKKLYITQQVAQGMASLHSTLSSNSCVIHHNLKTSNIMIAENWHVKVVDYFLGNRFLRQSVNKEEIANEFEQPFFWVAPEVLMNTQYDSKADVYSFGFIMYELITHSRPGKDVRDIAELIDKVCNQNHRPALPDDAKVPAGYVSLMRQCWTPNPALRPTFKNILADLEEIITHYVLGENEEVAHRLWRTKFRGKDCVEWEDFVTSFHAYFRLPVLRGDDTFEFALKCFREVIADSDDMVTINNFSNMLKWFGPMKGPEIISKIVLLYSKSYFHGQMSSIQAEDLLNEKPRGSYLIRFSTSSPGNFALSASSDDGSVRHYKIWRQPDGSYTIGKGLNYDDLDALVQGRREALNLKIPCTKRERYSDTNFWKNSSSETIENHNEIEIRGQTVPSLKMLCFKYIFMSSEMFSFNSLPADLIEEYSLTIINAGTRDEAGRAFWKQYFLGRDVIPWLEFIDAFAKFVDSKQVVNAKLLRFLLQDIAEKAEDYVSFETFGKLLEWFGPLNDTFFERMEKIASRPWFHGNLSHLQAEKLIQIFGESRPGVFLIRFSSKNRGYFTITTVSQKDSTALLHYRVFYNRETMLYLLGERSFFSLEELIDVYNLQLFLRFPCGGSKYLDIENHKKKNLLRLSSYLCD